MMKYIFLLALSLFVNNSAWASIDNTTKITLKLITQINSDKNDRLTAKSKAIYDIFWQAIIEKKVNFSVLEEQLNDGDVKFSENFYRYTQNKIKNNDNLLLASLFYHILYLDDNTGWNRLDKFADEIKASYKAALNGKPYLGNDLGYIKGIFIDNAHHQYDKAQTDFSRLETMWLLGNSINVEPISAYYNSSNKKREKNSDFEGIDRYYKEFATLNAAGKLPFLGNAPTIHYTLRAKKDFYIKLWSDVGGVSFFQGYDGKLYFFDGDKILVDSNYKIKSVTRKITRRTWLLSALEKISDIALGKPSYSGASYVDFANLSGVEQRALYLNKKLSDTVGGSNYVEVILKEKTILLNIDSYLDEDSYDTEVKQFLIEFDSVNLAQSAFDYMQNNISVELLKISPWYHDSADNYYGVITRIFSLDDDEVTLSPYIRDIELSSHGACKTLLSEAEMQKNKPKYLAREAALYEKGYVLRYILSNTHCTKTMPWEDDPDIGSQVIKAFHFFGSHQGISVLKQYRVNTQPYDLKSSYRLDNTKLGQSRMWGLPDIPSNLLKHLQWPSYRQNNQKIPMDFLLQINFSELHQGSWNKQYPHSGLMVVFLRDEISRGSISTVAYLFEDIQNLTQLQKPQHAAPSAIGQNSLKPQYFIFADELVGQYPIREWGRQYDNNNIIDKLDAKGLLKAYYTQHYSIGAYARDSRAYNVLGVDQPIFLQMDYQGQDLHLYIDFSQTKMHSSNKFKVLKIHADWMGWYD